jgi:putative tryptophan/tyrosine transport system substrate-binding protein
VRRRDFTIGLLLAATHQPVRAQETTKQHRIAIVEAYSVAVIDDPGSRYWQAFWQELRRLGDVEGQNLAVARYSIEGRPETDAEVAREAVGHNPDVIVAITNHIAQAVHAANGTTPIVLFGGSVVEDGIVGSLAHPGGKITGVDAFAGEEMWGKLLQLLKEAVPSVSKVAFLALRGWGGRGSGAGQKQVLQDASQRLQISLVPALIDESTPSEFQRAFAEIAKEGADAIMVHGRGELVRSRQLIVELAQKNHLPAIYGWREYVEAGGLMAYAADFREFGRRLAGDVHEILNGANPGDIPIYLPTRYELVINLKAARAIGLTIPAALLSLADEVIE